MAHTNNWDATNESSPANSDPVSEGASKIRSLKLDIRERIDLDHYMDIAGTQADHGEHRKVTFHEPLSSDPTPGTNKAALYTKDVSAKAELHFEDEDSNVIPMTSAGKVGSSLTDGVFQDLSVKNDLSVENDADVTGTVKADTIAEHTADTGVTVDGLLIKDGRLNDIGMGSMGKAMRVLYERLDDGVLAPGSHSVDWSSWSSVATLQFLCPPDPTTLQLRIKMKHGSGGDCYARLYCSSGDTSETLTATGSMAWHETTTGLDISGLTPGTWYTVEVQMYRPSGDTTGAFQGIVVYQGT